MLTAPKGFYIVVQTVSDFRPNPAYGSAGNLFVQTSDNKTQNYIAAPDAVADESVYPSATLPQCHVLLRAGTPVIVNAYRSSSDPTQETDHLIMTGYYVADTGD